MMDFAVIIERVRRGEIGFADALALASREAGAVADIGCARVDHGRGRRCGFPEFIYGASKDCESLGQIVAELVERSGAAMVTRLDRERGEFLSGRFPQGEYDPVARTFVIGCAAERRPDFSVALIAAGTSDLPVAGEARRTLEFCGIAVEQYTDVGVAGIERLFAVADRLRSVGCCIVIAGMEGALPSVVGGLVKCPVIAVPTSVGYGVALGGLAALAGMLNSCASGVTVVNIDNGFGAACAAIRLANLMPELE